MGQLAWAQPCDCCSSLGVKRGGGKNRELAMETEQKEWNYEIDKKRNEQGELGIWKGNKGTEF